MMLIGNAKTISQTNLLSRIGAILLFGLLTGVGARIAIPLPFSPVPLTMQVLFVLLAGLALGSRGGALSQAAYALAITCGLPLDARAAGPAVWLLPTAGYLLGFIAAAFVTGWVSERLRSSTASRLLAGATGIAVLYLAGVTWLTIFFLQGDLTKGILAGAAPFLMVDLIKAAIAALLASSSRDFLRRLPGG